MSDTSLAAVRPLPNYRERRAHIFKGQHSLQWFVRCNRDELIKAGALVMLGGRWYAQEDKFDAVVQRVGEDAARRHAGAALESA